MPRKRSCAGRASRLPRLVLSIIAPSGREQLARLSRNCAACFLKRWWANCPIINIGFSQYLLLSRYDLDSAALPLTCAPTELVVSVGASVQPSDCALLPTLSNGENKTTWHSPGCLPHPSFPSPCKRRREAEGGDSPSPS